jgi:hypothetical protein
MKEILFVLHIASLCAAGIGVLMADSSAFAWLRGKREVVGKETLFVAHWVVSIALAGLILTGLALFWPMRDYLVGQPLFWVKMTFVSALVINSFFIEYLMHTAAHHSFKSLSHRQKLPLMLSGAVSTVSWLGAGLCALMLF